MSTFVGRMREYADISIDRFDGVNLDSNAYFLSHNHSDHTVGLAADTLRYRLQSEHHIKLYCSEVTRHLLLCFDKYKHLANAMVALPLNETSIVSIPDITTGKEKYKLNVTLLPAGHCPGSVMFLFEGHEETVLYTGDFRLDHGDISQIEALKSGNGPKELKSLYIDTTFCVPAALFIPSREESSNAVISIAEEWISQSRRHMVVIAYRALLGYEDLFRRLSEHFNMRVHVTKEKYEQYLGLADLSKFTTPHPEDTQIHACKYLSGRTVKSVLPCGYTPLASSGGEPPLIRTIKVSTMAFVKPVAPDSYALRYNDTSFHVCYSFHSSYGELREVILFLRPHHAFPNVIPMGDTMPQIEERLNRLAELARRSLEPRSPWQHRELGKLKRKRKWRRPMTQNLEQSENLDFGDFESSPEKRLCSNSRQPVKVKFPILTGGSDCEEPSTEITTDHKSSSQEKHSSGEDSDYRPSDSGPLDASFDLFDDDDDGGVLEEEKNVMQSFTPTKGGSYGEFAFYVSDAEEEDAGGVSPAPGVDRWPEVEPSKAEELCPAKSQNCENGFIVNKLNTDLEVRSVKASRDSDVVEPKEATAREPMDVEVGPELCEQPATDSKAPETTEAMAASERGHDGDTARKELQRNTAEDVKTLKVAANETNSNKSNAATESITSHPSTSVADNEPSGKDGNESPRATASTEPMQCATQRRTEAPKIDVSSTTRPAEKTTSTAVVGVAAIGSGSRDEKIVGTAGKSRNTNTHEADIDVVTQKVSSSIKPDVKGDKDSNRLDESRGKSGKCRSGGTPKKSVTLGETKSKKNGESTEKVGDDADVTVVANAATSAASQKHGSPVNGTSKKDHVNGRPRQVKPSSSEATSEVSGRDRHAPAVNWTDEVIVIDDDDPAPTASAPPNGPRWSSNMTVDITCETTDSEATVDPTEGVLPRGCRPAVRPIMRNRDGAVLAVSGLMLDDTTTSSSDSYVSPGERRRRRRRWRKPRWSSSRPGDSSSSYFHQRHVTGNNPGPSGSKPRLGSGATIDLTSGDDDTEAAPDVGGAGDAGVADIVSAAGVVDGYYADNEGGQSDSDASSAAEWDEADSPLFKAKRDSSRDVVVTSDVDVIVLDDDTSDDCAGKDDAGKDDAVASKPDDVASERDTRTVVQKPIAVSDGAVEK